MGWVTHLEEGVIKVKHLSAHEVFGTNSAENYDVTPNALIAKNTNSTTSIETSKGLRYLGREGLARIYLGLSDVTHLVVKASLLDHGDEDIVSLTGDLNSLLGNIAKNPNGNPRSAIEVVSRRFQAENENGNEKLVGD